MDQAIFDRALDFLQEEEREQASLSLQLYQRELTLSSNLTDYSFFVFPMAKAYEGYIKRYLFDLQLINQKVYEGKRFRIGRALNPDLRESQRNEYWLFDDVVRKCGEDIARQIWNTWLECRNQIFHYFPHSPKSLNLEQAEKCLIRLAQTIEAAGMCVKINHK